MIASPASGSSSAAGLGQFSAAFERGPGRRWYRGREDPRPAPQAADAGPETFRLITTVLDPEDVTAAELAAAYHERWEYEISLKEIETQMLEPGGGLRL